MAATKKESRWRVQAEKSSYRVKFKTDGGAEVNMASVPTKAAAETALKKLQRKYGANGQKIPADWLADKTGQEAPAKPAKPSTPKPRGNAATTVDQAAAGKVVIMEWKGDLYPFLIERVTEARYYGQDLKAPGCKPSGLKYWQTRMRAHGPMTEKQALKKLKELQAKAA